MLRPDKQNIPVLSNGIRAFLAHEKAAGSKDIANTRSILLGTDGRVIGRLAAGPAFAQSEYRGVRMDRLEAPDFTRMYELRVPPHLAPATRKRAMSDMRGLIEYSIGQGWLHERVAAAIVSNMPDSPPVNHWLYPEQLDAINRLIAESDEFDPYHDFAHDTCVSLGTRSFETVNLRRDSLDPRTNRVSVIGKGRGAGKKRWIGVDDAYAARWDEHARRYEIRRDGFMFFQRRRLVTGGSGHDLGLVVDRNRHATEKSLRSLYTKLQQWCETSLPVELQPNFKLTPKVMRRSFACTQLILHALGLGGLDLRSLQEALGHDSLETTQLYLADVHAYLNLRIHPVNARDGVQLILAKLAGS